MAEPYLKYDDPYFRVLNPSESNASEITYHIAAVCSFVEKYLRRTLLQAEFDEIVTVNNDGSVVLRNIPVARISRVMAATGNWLTIQNTSGSVSNANYSTDADNLYLTSINTGVRTNLTIPYQSFPTLGTLSAHINSLSSLGWTASVESGFENYPSGDLVAAQFGTAKTAAQTLTSWAEDGRVFSFDPKTGIIEGIGGIQQSELYAAVPNTGFNRWNQLRIVYTGGFDAESFPEELRMVTAHLIVSAIQSPMGRVMTEDIGGQYSYTLADFAKAPMSDQRVLGLYRRRGC